MKNALLIAMAVLSAAGAFADKLQNGASYSLKALPAELVAQAPKGQSVRFSLEENATTGYSWEMEHNASECDVTMVRKAADNGLVGTPGQVMVEVKSKVQTPARVEFRYRRPWEKNSKPAHTLRLLLYTVGANKATDPRYPKNDVFRLLMKECSERGIVLVDWHLHIRGGMTPELAALREKDSGIRSSAMENHGREWEIYDNAKLAAFADQARAIDVDGHRLPVGIQVNDRDWFRQIDDATRAKFDYILADTMIMGKLPNGRDNRLWMVKEIADPDAWMEEYFRHNMAILDEPISILANPTYLPLPIADQYDRLWTEERMRALIAKAVEKGIAIEIQAGSTFPRPKFLRLAKEMGAKFSFGTNNFDPTPKDLSRWLEAITWLDLKGSDIWTPSCLKRPPQ